MLINNKSAILVLLLIPLLSFSQLKNDWQKMELKGKVQKMRTFNCNLDSAVGYNESTATFYVDKHFVFNENGYLTENYEYNQETNIAEFKEVIEYDSLNRKVKSTTRNLTIPDNSPNIIAYKYNDLNLLIETLSEAGYKSSRTNFFYDENNNLVKTVLSSSQSKSEIFFKYNAFNQLIEEYMPDNYNITKKYDSLGRISTIKYEYLAEKSIDQVNYIYNENNFEIENHISITENGVTTTYLVKIEYQFDKMGNWIQRSKLIDNKIVELTKRSIVYFP